MKQIGIINPNCNAIFINGLRLVRGNIGTFFTEFGKVSGEIVLLRRKHLQ